MIKTFLSENMVLIVLVAILAFVFIMIAIFWPFGNDAIVSEEIYKTGLGDEFRFKYKDTEYSSAQRTVTVYDSNDVFLGSFATGGGAAPKMSVVIDSEELRCYELGGYLFFRVRGSEFKALLQNFLVYSSTTHELIDGYNKRIFEYTDDPDNVLLAEELFCTKEWKWVKTFAWLLLSTRDYEVSQTMERYSKGLFTEEELEINSGSKIGSYEIESYTKQLLKHTA